MKHILNNNNNNNSNALKWWVSILLLKKSFVLSHSLEIQESVFILALSKFKRVFFLKRRKGMKKTNAVAGEIEGNNLF